jgi:hypothetical protein
VLPKPNADSNADEFSSAYLSKVRRGQQSSLSELEALASSKSIPLLTVPFFDREVRTVYGLRVIGNAIFDKSSE